MDNLKLTCSTSVICVPFWRDVWFSQRGYPHSVHIHCEGSPCVVPSVSGITPIPYIAIARGSACVVPSVKVKTVLLTYRFEGCLNELSNACCSAGQRNSTSFRESSLLRTLKAFSAIKNEYGVRLRFLNLVPQTVASIFDSTLLA